MVFCQRNVNNTTLVDREKIILSLFHITLVLMKQCEKTLNEGDYCYKYICKNMKEPYEKLLWKRQHGANIFFKQHCFGRIVHEGLQWWYPDLFALPRDLSETRCRIPNDLHGRDKQYWRNRTYCYTHLEGRFIVRESRERHESLERCESHEAESQWEDQEVRLKHGCHLLR